MFKFGLDRETFLYLASSLGFDKDDPHLDDLYPGVLTVLETIEPLDDLKLKGVPIGLEINSSGAN